MQAVHLVDKIEHLRQSPSQPQVFPWIGTVPLGHDGSQRPEILKNPFLQAIQSLSKPPVQPMHL